MGKLSREGTFGFLVHDVGRLMRTEFDRRVRGLGFTRAQWRVLAHLMRAQGINQRQLSDLMDVEPITLVRLLDKLEDGGFVERRQDPSDRRAYLLYLTPKSRPFIDQLEAVASELREEVLAGLSPSERAVLIDMLVRIKGNMTNRSSESVLEAAVNE